MSTLKAPSQGRGHRRSPSDDRRQAAVLSPSTKGPLDEDGDMTSSTILSPSPSNRGRSRSPLPPPQIQGLDQTRQTILSLLCRPEIYRPLPPNMIPQPFLTSTHAPKHDTSISSLISNGHFHAAAITAARLLSSMDATADLDTVFDLFYTRLACLSLINKTCLEIAAVESLELRDLTASMYTHPIEGTHLAPWHLRVLAVRLQSIGFKDWRRGVMSYYILAHDARAQVSRAQSPEEKTLWEARLRDLGVRVANMLVEMGDLSAAGRHLRTLDTEGLDERARRKLVVMQVMLWLQTVDLRAAKRALASLFPPSESVASPTLEAMDVVSPDSAEEDDYQPQVLHALTHMAEGNYPAAISEWSTLLSAHPEDDMIASNLSICLLYTGQFSQAMHTLQQRVEESDGVPYHALLFNLCTFYELGTERASDVKRGLVERVAGKEPKGTGWQRAGADFKMEVVGTARA